MQISANTQQIHLSNKKTPYLSKINSKGYKIPASFYKNGYALVKNIKNDTQAQDVLENFIASIDTDKLPIYKSFHPKVKLAKKDEIPVCGDSVETSFQALHFDMGQPMMSDEAQNMFLITGLYISPEKSGISAKTRVISLRGLLKNKFGSAKEVEEKILNYVKNHGDGWTYPDKVNTYRISCFARVLDAVAETEELADYFDKTMAQWFQDPDNKDGHHSKEGEKAFYKARGINLESIEEDVALAPGQLLIVDNMRTAHGRIGKRAAKETLQFMYGVEANVGEINQFRKDLVKLLTA